jgi:hypothetical protein
MSEPPKSLTDLLHRMLDEDWHKRDEGSLERTLYEMFANASPWPANKGPFPIDARARGTRTHPL